MNSFEYLSVLVSIIIGLGISHLLVSTARLIQRRDRLRWYAPTLIWMALLFLVQVQIWWAAYEDRNDAEWHFFSFLSFLLIPVCAALLGYLLVPDLERADTADLRAEFHRNRGWFFGLLTAAASISLLRDLFDDGVAALDGDWAFRIVFLITAVLGAVVRSDRFQLANALLVAVTFVGYVVTLFVRLR